MNRIVTTEAPLAAASAVALHTGLVAVVSDKEAEDTRWRQWQVKGRADDARFRRRLRTVLLDIAGAAALGGALWFALTRW